MIKLGRLEFGLRRFSRSVPGLRRIWFILISWSVLGFKSILRTSSRRQSFEGISNAGQIRNSYLNLTVSRPQWYWAGRPPVHSYFHRSIAITIRDEQMRKRDFVKFRTWIRTRKNFEFRNRMFVSRWFLEMKIWIFTKQPNLSKIFLFFNIQWCPFKLCNGMSNDSRLPRRNHEKKRHNRLFMISWWTNTFCTPVYRSDFDSVTQFFIDYFRTRNNQFGTSESLSGKGTIFYFKYSTKADFFYDKTSCLNINLRRCKKRLSRQI